jgi:hypothetical protein
MQLLHFVSGRTFAEYASQLWDIFQSRLVTYLSNALLKLPLKDANFARSFSETFRQLQLLNHGNQVIRKNEDSIVLVRGCEYPIGMRMALCVLWLPRKIWVATSESSV